MKKKYLNIKTSKLEKLIFKKSNEFLDAASSKILAKLIVRAEKMKILTHGIHYFVHSVHPLLKQKKIFFKNKVIKNYVYTEALSDGAVGIINTFKCLSKASEIAKKSGFAMFVAKNPGKVGALRVYCPEIIKKNQLIVLLKNTAPTQGTKKTKKAVIGTNPLAIGIPGSKFIYDSSTSTVATNSIRLKNKYNENFDINVGFSKNLNLTKKSKILLNKGSYLNTFAENNFWFKSFYLGIAIELIGALCGGNTSYRVGESKGSRLYSQEGMLGIIIDKSVFPSYKKYKSEMKLLINELKKMNLRIPGKLINKKNIRVFKEDLEKILT